MTNTNRPTATKHPHYHPKPKHPGAFRDVVLMEMSNSPRCETQEDFLELCLHNLLWHDNPMVPGRSPILPVTLWARWPAADIDEADDEADPLTRSFADRDYRIACAKDAVEYRATSSDKTDVSAFLPLPRSSKLEAQGVRLHYHWDSVSYDVGTGHWEAWCSAAAISRPCGKPHDDDIHIIPPSPSTPAAR